MTITGSLKRKDAWENGGIKTQQPFWFFLLFFCVHYGMFITIQLLLFLNVIPGQNIGLIDFISNYTSYIGPNGLLMLTLFVIGYGYRNLFGFIATGSYKKASLVALMFQPYARIFIQQFTVIVGSFFLLFNGGKVFILVFALARIVFEVFYEYERRIIYLVQKSHDRSNSHS